MFSRLFARLAASLPGLFTAGPPLLVPVRAESARGPRYLHELSELLHRREP